MALIKCKECGKEVSERAITCPHCGARIGNGHSRKANTILVTILLTIAVVCTIGIIFVMNLPGANEAPANNGYITINQFNSVETGMTYEQVVNIFGHEGELMSESEILDTKTSMYVWYGYSLGSNANLMFQDGKLISKTQIGLE